MGDAFPPGCRRSQEVSASSFSCLLGRLRPHRRSLPSFPLSSPASFAPKTKRNFPLFFFWGWAGRNETPYGPPYSFLSCTSPNGDMRKKTSFSFFPFFPPIPGLMQVRQQIGTYSLLPFLLWNLPTLEDEMDPELRLLRATCTSFFLVRETCPR